MRRSASQRWDRIESHHALLIKVDSIGIPKLAIKEWDSGDCLECIAAGMTFGVEYTENLADKSPVTIVWVAYDHLGSTDVQLYTCVIHRLAEQYCSCNDNIILINNDRNIVFADQRMILHPLCYGIGIDCAQRCVGAPSEHDIAERRIRSNGMRISPFYEKTIAEICTVAWVKNFHCSASYIGS